MESISLIFKIRDCTLAAARLLFGSMVSQTMRHLYIDSEGSTLVLLNADYWILNHFYKSVVIWNASTGGHANKLVLQDDGNLVLRNDYNKIIWETNTTGACPAGLE